MRSTTELIDYVWTEAEEMGIELDAVRSVDADGDGVVIRVLLEDGENESDQVGFQVSRPNVETGRNMFNRRLTNGLREIRRRTTSGTAESTDEQSNSDNTDVDPGVELSAVDTMPQQTEDNYHQENNTTKSDTTKQDLGSLSISVEMGEESRDKLVDDFESIKDDISEITVTQSELDSLEERIDDVDARLQKLEEYLSMFGSE